ncbi:MAG: HNH endonuclease [Pirellulales bacterium]|nr:HNH endonuclease [Pirellulales bacterium]
MKWKDLVYQRVISFCNEIGSRTFSLDEFFAANEGVLRQSYPKNRFPRQKTCEMLQQLRNDGIITFLDYTGNYTLRGVDLLDVEKDETKTIDLSLETPERKEYMIESYVRNVRWARLAREVFGDYCLFEGCNNTFLRNDATPYIEVHHIIPLYKNGENSLFNLCVLCAHHHKMAHFADHNTVKHVESLLTSINQDFLRNHHAR